MADVSLPLSCPLRWRVPRELVILFALILLALNWASVQSASQALSDALNCRTKLGKMADRVTAFVLHRGSRCVCDGTLDLSTGCKLPMLR